jgi:tRNA threonylcarbamoyladenosine biosynthesis protein TsaB
LALETSTAMGSVAIWKDRLVFEQSLRIQGSHSELVLPAIDHALAVSGTRPEEVSAFVAGAGPGSFTGVRVAASLLKGWAMARGIPVFAYSSLLVVAAGSGSAAPVCAVFDARRGQVYAACYQIASRGPKQLVAPAAWGIEGLLAELERRGLRPDFVGEGALVHRETLLAAFEGARVLPEPLAVPRAASLLWLRQLAPELGRVSDPGAWEPLYLRDWRVREEERR